MGFVTRGGGVEGINEVLDMLASVYLNTKEY